MSENPLDDAFLKANAAALRALAGGTEHHVRYVGQDSHVGGDEVRLPAPPREKNPVMQRVCGWPIMIAKPIIVWLRNHRLHGVSLMRRRKRVLNPLARMIWPECVPI